MSISLLVESNLETNVGFFKVRAYSSQYPDFPHLAFFPSLPQPADVVDVRIHSECFTGDLLGSARCDCGQQLDFAMKWVQQSGGVIVYLRQEGRGIGLVNKLKAYNLQDEGVNTKDANLHLGFEADQRAYGDAISILEDLSISKIRLMTNNPDKLEAFSDSEIKVMDRIPIEIEPLNSNLAYMKTKKHEMGHILNHIG